MDEKVKNIYEEFYKSPLKENTAQELTVKRKILAKEKLEEQKVKDFSEIDWDYNISQNKREELKSKLDIEYDKKLQKRNKEIEEDIIGYKLLFKTENFIILNDAIKGIDNEIYNKKKEVNKIQNDIQDYYHNLSNGVANEKTINELYNELDTKQKELENLQSEKSKVEKLLSEMKAVRSGFTEKDFKDIEQYSKKNEKNEEENKEDIKSVDVVEPSAEYKYVTIDKQNSSYNMEPTVAKEMVENSNEAEENKIIQNNEENLPVVSGLQIYNKVLQEVGIIKGTKTIRVESVLSHLPFGKLLGAPLRLLTSRKKEIKRISDVIEDFDYKKEFGISKDEAIDLMLDDCLLKGGEGRGIIKLKVNDIFLRGLTKNLQNNVKRRTNDLQADNDKIMETMKKLEKSREDADDEKKVKIDKVLDELNTRIDKNISIIERISDQPRIVDRAREDKSYNKKDNIMGADAAIRDMDSRDVISNLASIEKQKLEAERAGNIASVAHYQRKMNEYMDSQTIYKKGLFGKGTISIGAFEAPMGKAKVVSNKDYVFMKLAGAIGSASILGALTLKKQLDILSKQMDITQMQSEIEAQQRVIQSNQNAINSQNNSYNEIVENIREAKGKITPEAADNAVYSVIDDAGRSSIVGEREASLVGNFNEHSRCIYWRRCKKCSRGNVKT